MDISLDLLLPRETASVPATRKILDASLQALGVDEQIRDDIEVMLTEACTNVIKHARHGDDYTVRAAIHDERCVIKVIDSGRGFDAEQIPEPDPISEAGRGLMIIRSLADDVRFDSYPEDGALVALEKHLDYAAGSIGGRLADSGSPQS
ncbi:ATP-binding protein [Actinomadura verrucosospora]|uniref:Serine/threonine kinase anti-sigma factor n=1 Tax=Actinomadura verrucosospora TaxID=46165 RepID=A0A7D3VRD1_ACTVE|nr:ATP-binding protein [Actinomadura verrucosospora]QKG20533.1 serine/threonine kinase anti-sigma factor [Actinomadura verrucosospora]